MAAEKITAKSEIGAAPAADDQLVIVDVSDTTEAASGTTKRVNASRVARTGAANTFAAAQTITAATEALNLVGSGQPLTVNLRNDTRTILDFRNNSGETLFGRIEYNVANALIDVQSRGTSSSILFKTANGSSTLNEAARFDPNHYLLIGYTTSNGAFRLQVNSQIYATNATVATSDERVKENVETLADGLAAVMALRPVVFDFVEHEVHNFSHDRQVGFIAQEIETVLAEDEYLRCIVPETQNEEQLKGVAGDKIVALLVRAVQQQQAQIDALTARVEALEGGE
jgi:hypothetical protein